MTLRISGDHSGIDEAKFSSAHSANLLSELTVLLKRLMIPAQKYRSG